MTDPEVHRYLNEIDQALKTERPETATVNAWSDQHHALVSDLVYAIRTHARHDCPEVRTCPGFIAMATMAAMPHDQMVGAFGVALLMIASAMDNHGEFHPDCRECTSARGDVRGEE